MQSVTTAERRRAVPTFESPALPVLSFVHPIPGFTDLRRFVLVRLDDADEAAATAGGPVVGSVAGSAVGSDAADRPVPAQPAAADAADADDSPLGFEGSPLYELRSLDQADVRFMVAVPGAFFSDYEIELDDQECGDLGLTDSGDALVLVMLTVGRDAASTTANLLAPVVINARTRAAAQVILTGSDWPVRAPLG
jgi:flagellar assembly factor FliW